MTHKTGRVEHQTSTNSRDHQIAKTDIIEARALISDNPDDEGTVSRTSGAALNGIVKIPKENAIDTWHSHSDYVWRHRRQG